MFDAASRLLLRFVLVGSAFLMRRYSEHVCLHTARLDGFAPRSNLPPFGRAMLLPVRRFGCRAVLQYSRLCRELSVKLLSVPIRSLAAFDSLSSTWM